MSKQETVAALRDARSNGDRPTAPRADLYGADLSGADLDAVIKNWGGK